MTIDMTEVLSRSRASLDPIVRETLTAGRTVRSRNRDGEYAVVLTGPAVVNTTHGDRIDGVADDRADWTIAVPDFTLKNVVEAGPDLDFWAPVFVTVSGSARSGSMALRTGRAIPTKARWRR